MTEVLTLRPRRTLPPPARRLASGVLGLLVSLVLAATMMFAFAVGPATAQSAPSTPTVLSSVTVNKDAQGQIQVVLGFSQSVPRYSIIANDNPKPTIAFAGTVRGQSASFPTGLLEPVKDAVFNESDSILTLAFASSAPIHLVANQSGDRQLTLSFSAPVANPVASDGSPISALPAYADRNPDEDQFDVVPLKYADISEVVGLLSADESVKPNDTFTPPEPAFGSAGMMNNNNGGAPNVINPGVPTTDPASLSVGHSVDDTIGVDRRLNAIILHGTADRIARLKDKIAKIDVPITSVILETVFVELTQTGARNVGLDFNNANSQIATATFDTGGYVPSGWNSNGVTSLALQAAVYAQVQKGEGRIISKPRISAQSGSSAKIITGDAIPILTSITLSGVNGVSQQVQYVTVGVTLQIAPRVTDDGWVTSHVFCEVSSVTGYSQGYPTISQREASTSATVRDGESFVIGGLTEENDLTSNGKVPVAGDVPLLGKLFQHESDTKSKTELYIVVTPHIVRASDSVVARQERDLGEPVQARPATAMAEQPPPPPAPALRGLE